MKYEAGGRRRFFAPGQSPKSMATGEKFMLCPQCGQRVKVGGPISQDTYVVQIHAPLHPTLVNEVCSGTNMSIKASL
jgi:hypothetical protein